MSRHPIQPVPNWVSPASNAHAVRGPFLTGPVMKTIGKKYMTSLSAAGSIDMEASSYCGVRTKERNNITLLKMT